MLSRSLPPAFALVCAAVLGCTTPVPFSDDAPTAGLDAGPGTDAPLATDAPAADTPATDTGVPDDAPTGMDGGGADAGGTDAGPADGGASCAVFATVPGYMSCVESAGMCEFSYSDPTRTCRDVCMAAGGNCIDAWNAIDPTMPCVPGPHRACGSLNSDICVCVVPF